MRSLLLTLSLTSLALFSFSCDSGDAADEPIPAMEATLERTFTYHDTGEENKVKHTTNSMNISAFYIENEELYLVFTAGKDQVSFQIKEEARNADFVGKYALKTATAGKANTTYTYYTSEKSGNSIYSGGNTLAGFIEITAYHNKHNLISGVFELTSEVISDPTAALPATVDRRCDITIKGEFKNTGLTINP